MMRNDNQWPRMMLPLKNSKDGRLGYMLDSAPVVFLGNCFTTSTVDEEINYASWDDLLDAGWIVD